VSQALTPEEIENAEFHVTMRGFARDEVQEVLTAAAAHIRSLQEKAETAYLNLGAKMGELLQQAKDGAEELQSAARQEAARQEQDARARATDILQTAENHAAKIIREAEERVAELRTAEDEISRALHSLRTNLIAITERWAPPEPPDFEPEL
jgi:DivIVA domain-containing protein